MQLHLIRHTRLALPPGICYGRSDVALAHSYANERDDLRSRWQNIVRTQQPDAVFCSPATRCQRLARDLFGAAAVPDARLQELDFGEWELRTWDEIQKQDSERAEQWMQSFVTTRCPGGESYLQLVERVRDFLNEVRRADCVVLLAHGGSIRAALAALLDWPLELSFQIQIIGRPNL